MVSSLQIFPSQFSIAYNFTELSNNNIIFFKMGKEKHLPKAESSKMAKKRARSHKRSKKRKIYDKSI